MSPMLLDVWVNRWTLKSLVASAVEVYPRETMGLLWGVKSQRKLDGRRRRVLSLKSAHPVQTARRKYTKVEWGNKAAKRRLLKMLRSIRAGIVGGFHSHPKTGALAEPSSDDLSYYLRESLDGREIMGKEWIEMVIRIREYGGRASHEESVYGGYKYRRAERFHVDLIDKAYDFICLSV